MNLVCPSSLDGMRSRLGQCDSERASNGRPALDRYAPAEQFCEAPGHRQADSAAAGFAGSRLLDLPEWIEDVLEALVIDTDAGIYNLEYRLVTAFQDANDNLASARESHGIGYQAHQDLPQLGHVGLDHQVRVDGVGA